MKFKILIFALLISSVCSAQNFFGRVGAVEPTAKPVNKFYFNATQPDSTIKAFRPVVSPIAYSYPGNHAMIGAGVAYEELDWNYGSQVWDVPWSVGVYAWYNTPLPSGTSTNNTPVSFGPAITVLNGTLLLGAAYDAHKLGAVVGINIKLN